jgi:predicted O-methyltransferase YrrM
MGDISTTNIDTQIDAYADWAAQPWVRTICEIGFAIGTSTITYLESNDRVRVVSFDVMGMDGASDAALAFVQERYGAERVSVVRGFSQETLPAKQHVLAGMCDMISVDGMHDITALTDLRNFKALANPRKHIILADDCVPHDVYNKKKEENPHVG